MSTEPLALRLRPAGATGLLVEVGGTAEVHALAAWLRRSEFAPQIEDLVPGGATVLIRASRSVDDIAQGLRGLVLDIDATAAEGRTLQVPVVYDGPDLDEVRERTGLTRDELVALHSGARCTVAFFGFTPGFPYIDGLPDALRVPRRPVPRTSIEAGSVAIANGLTVIYPGGTPGGWNIIGRTDLAPLWDVDRDPPNLVDVGDRIVFTSVP